MPLAEINLPSGKYRDGTQYQARGRWYDGSLTRFYEATVRPRGGWTAHSASTVTGKARAIATWTDNSGVRWIAIGTSTHLYAYNHGGDRFDITPSGLATGLDDAVSGGGYGNGLYGAGDYGMPRTDTSIIQDCTVWTLDTFGQYLIGTNADDGRIFEWQLNTAVIAAHLTTDSPPTNNRAVVVTPERFIMALGANGNPRLVWWADQGHDDVWTPAATNRAGFYQLQTGGRLMCGRRIRGGTLLFTDQDVHLATAQDPPINYGFQQLATGCGIVSQAAVAIAGNIAIWMGKDGFWTYDGVVQPLESDVGDYVFSNLNLGQKSKIFAVHNPSFGEVDFYYPSASSTEIDSYVTLNYRENHWDFGSLARTCGIEKGAIEYPLMVDPSGALWEHEIGFSYTGADMPWIETGPLELNSSGGLSPSSFAGPSGTILHVLSLIPDVGTSGDGLSVELLGKFLPIDDDTTHGPYSLARQVDVRVTAREFRARFSGTSSGDFRIGIWRADVRPGGTR